MNVKNICQTLPLALAVALCGCSDDNNAPLPDLAGKTYEGLSVFNLSYDGSPMVGKSATLDPTGSTASITFSSKFDPSSLSSALKDLPAIPAPGVLPGSPELKIPVYLKPDNGKYVFAGSGETEYVTYEYAGDILEDKMDFNFLNVKLKNQSLAGSVWKPVPLTSTSSPFHIVWETSLPGPLEFFDGTIEDALKLLVKMPIIPVYNNTAYMSLSQVIASGLETICFNPDGNLVVTYLQSANGAAQFAQAPLCMIQYLPLTEGVMKLYVNPTDLMSVIVMNVTNKPEIPSNPFGSPAKKTRGDDSAAYIVSPEQILAIAQKIAPLLAEGLPVAYTKTDSTLDIYLSSEFILPMIQEVVAPLLTDPLIQAALLEKIESDPHLQPYLKAVKGLLTALPQLLQSTTRIELGLAFQK